LPVHTPVPVLLSKQVLEQAAVCSSGI